MSDSSGKRSKTWTAMHSISASLSVVKTHRLRITGNGEELSRLEVLTDSTSNSISEKVRFPKSLVGIRCSQILVACFHGTSQQSNRMICLDRATRQREMRGNRLEVMHLTRVLLSHQRRVPGSLQEALMHLTKA